MSVTTVPLSEVALVFNGKTPAKSDQRIEGHPVLKIRDVDERGEFRGPFESFVEPDYVAKYADKVIQSGDSMVLNAAHNADYVASKSFFASVEAVGSLATGEWLMIRPDGDQLHAGFARHWVTSPATRFKMKELVKGIHLYPKDVARLPIPLPPIEEQRRIAAVLDAADALRAKRRQAIAKLDSLTQAIFIDMFGDPLTNPMGWAADRVLSDVADARSGITKGRKTGDAQLTAVPYLAVVNVQDGFIELKPLKSIDATESEIERYRLLEGDILLTEGGDPDKLGRGAVWTAPFDPCIHQNHVFRVRVTDEEMTPEFLSRLLGSTRGKRYFLRMAKQTTGIASINMTQLRKFPILEPPLSLQQEFLDRTRVVDEQLTLASCSEAEIDTLFVSLQQRAFRGEL
jgi:type I restriction enzyme S subunit